MCCSYSKILEVIYKRLFFHQFCSHQQKILATYFPDVVLYKNGKNATLWIFWLGIIAEIWCAPKADAALASISFSLKLILGVEFDDDLNYCKNVLNHFSSRDQCSGTFGIKFGGNPSKRLDFMKFFILRKKVSFTPSFTKFKFWANS